MTIIPVRGRHVAPPSPSALWAESCEARHAAGSEQAAGRHENALLLDMEAQLLLERARLRAARLGLPRLVRRITHRPRHARYPVKLGPPIPALVRSIIIS